MANQFVQDYLSTVAEKYSHEETSEIGYRTDFENLLRAIFAEINVRRFDHDPQAKGGNKPDFVVHKGAIPILYIETKDIGIDLDKVEKSEQMARYFGYDNLVLTDYLEFRFYRYGEQYVDPIKIADFHKASRTLTYHPEKYDLLARTLVEFPQTHKEPIKSGKHLSKIMGGKAQRIRDNIRDFLGIEDDRNSELLQVYETIQKLLIHDLTPHDFADMYAQTLVYGLFVARFYDESKESFTRQEARDLIPASNPLLRHFFDHIVGANFDKRLETIVNELCEVFAHSDVEKLMKQYLEVSLKGKTTRKQDTVIHFYENFLNEYDPVLRKKMGAYYTPLPVVNFIVRSVDDILRKEFKLPNGLANTSKLKDGTHKVQVLDPAVGTGTFISSVIGQIYQTFGAGQKGRWPTYVHNDLLPRIHGFELMMAPYTIAHLKLALAFKETGFKQFYRRLGIYLTNSLEQPTWLDGLFSAFGLAGSIAKESEEAAKVKNEIPVMVVLGNPPYSVSSTNKGEWILDQIKEYKKNLNEKKLNLDDDYIKFIRFAEHFVEKNKTGVVAMITNNSFIDGITHRQMRKHLMETFDEIYVLNLHGNSIRKETTPSGGKDENVFDIQQGVSINIFVRYVEDRDGLGQVWYADLYGRRSDKFGYLEKNNFRTIKWNKLVSSEPYYFFVPKDFGLIAKYNEGFGIDELFLVYGAGVKTERDKISIHFDRKSLRETVNDFIELPAEKIRQKHQLSKDSRDWSIDRAKEDVKRHHESEKYVKPINYRPFDIRWTYYTGISRGFLGTPGTKVMRNLLTKNVALVCARQFGGGKHFISFIANRLFEISSQPYAPYTAFPLYLYGSDGTRTLNLNDMVQQKIESHVGRVHSEEIFDYIYAVLYSQSYRDKYKEFLKIGFPKIPYPNNKETFQKLAKFGSELRELHLLMSPKVDEFITTFPEEGSDEVGKIAFRSGRVYINDTQYFGNIPEVSWNFWIGGYQPAQKWLKDRRGRKLTNEDIVHYQRVIVALVETDGIMKEVDKVFTI